MNERATSAYSRITVTKTDCLSQFMVTCLKSAAKMECSDGRDGYRGRSGYFPAAQQSVLVAPNQDGGPMVCAELASDSNKDYPETLKSGPTELKYSSSPSPYLKPMEDTPRLNFQIPRKSKEKRGCASLSFQCCSFCKIGIASWQHALVFLLRSTVCLPAY